MVKWLHKAFTVTASLCLICPFPAFSEMTAKAIDVLANDRRGFFLPVEGGRIDHARHAGNAYRALTDAIEFAKAVQVAVAKTDPKETLIIVPANHSHVFTIAGYPKRGNPILRKVVEVGETTLLWICSGCHTPPLAMPMGQDTQGN